MLLIQKMLLLVVLLQVVVVGVVILDMVEEQPVLLARCDRRSGGGSRGIVMWGLRWGRHLVRQRYEARRDLVLRGEERGRSHRDQLGWRRARGQRLRGVWEGYHKFVVSYDPKEGKEGKEKK